MHRRRSTGAPRPRKLLIGRGRSPGSRVLAADPSSQCVAPVTFLDRPLPAYSCGGSAGIAPASLLAPDVVASGEPRLNKWYPPRIESGQSNTDIHRILPEELCGSSHGTSSRVRAFLRKNAERGTLPTRVSFATVAPSEHLALRGQAFDGTGRSMTRQSASSARAFTHEGE